MLFLSFPLIDEPFLRHRHGLGKLSSIYRYFFPNQFFGLSILYLERGKKSRLSYHNKDRKLPEQSQFINNSEEKKNRKIKRKEIIKEKEIFIIIDRRKTIIIVNS